MTTLFVGDVHGCAEELQVLIDEVQPSQVFLTGDLFSKGPLPCAVWEIIKEHSCLAVMGNHDHWFVTNHQSARIKPDLRDLIDRHPEVIAYIYGLPFHRLIPIGHMNIVLIHAGVHPLLGLKGTDDEMAMVMRMFPMDGGTKHWYDSGWKGPELVVFGHDARIGLVQRFEGKDRIALGLDTGCVYGGPLTGWVAETNEFVTAMPQRRYHKGSLGTTSS